HHDVYAHSGRGGVGRQSTGVSGAGQHPARAAGPHRRQRELVARVSRRIAHVNAVLASWLVGSSLALAAADAPSPTFSRDVAPIVFRNCATCHHPGSNGAFSLLTYEDVRPRAKAIAAATRSRSLPPWKPDDGY